MQAHTHTNKCMPQWQLAALTWNQQQQKSRQQQQTMCAFSANTAGIACTPVDEFETAAAAAMWHQRTLQRQLWQRRR